MKVINYILLVLLLIALGIIGWLYFNPKIERVYVQIKPTPEIVYIEKKGGSSIATIPQQTASEPEQTLSENYIRYVNDTLKPALEEGLKYKVKFEQLTRANATLQDSLSRKNVVLNNVKKEVITWKTKYVEISVNPTDSTANYRYNAVLDVANYGRKRHLFSGKENYISISSPDKNLTINGVENFTRSFSAPHNFLELNILVHGTYFDGRIRPHANAEVLFNPDGRIRPFAGYGYIYSDNVFTPIIVGGLKFNVIKL